MNVIQTYQQGGKHKANNQPCEDRTYYLSKNGVEVIALADGAGSSKYTHSAEGAECVTRTISEFFCNNFDKFYTKDDSEELKAVLMSVCQRALQKKVEELGLDGISRLSSTLMCVAIKEEKVICCHIGDGVIGKLTSKGTEVVSSPENGEFAGTTYFITNPNADKYIHIIKENTNDAISYFLMSDGTSDYIYNKFDNSFYDAARKMATMSAKSNGQEELEKTINQYMIDRDKTSDDCSFICLSIDEKSVSDTNSLGTSDNAKSTTIIDNNASNKTSQNNNNTIKKFAVSSVKYEADRSNHNTKAQKEKKKRKMIIIVIVAFVLFACVVSGAVSKSSRSKQNSHITTQVQTTKETTTDSKTTTGSETITDSKTTTVSEATTDIGTTTVNDNTRVNNYI